MGLLYGFNQLATYIHSSRLLPMTSSVASGRSMSSRFPAQLQCVNPACRYADNPLGQQVCVQCDTPLSYRYLWAVGAGAETVAVGNRLGDRYVVVAPQVWLDTQPATPPDLPDSLPDLALPYLQLYAHRLHLPTLYGFQPSEHPTEQGFLLENVPLDSVGKLLPTLASVLKTAAPARQLYWLWQLLELWAPLLDHGVASSLLMPGNIRIDGWRVWLRELVNDRQSVQSPKLSDLANVWLSWVDALHPSIAQSVLQLCQQMQADSLKDGEPAGDDGRLRAIALRLNQLLLAQLAQSTLRLTTTAATSTGPQRTHNEDACYPLPARATDAGSLRESSELKALPQLAIVCDGIGGHAGGEVASQLAVRSLHLQIRALLNEVAHQPEIMSPNVVIQQLEAIIRVVNNLIAAQNDSQGREARQRMGTTLVMALQLPQRIKTTRGDRNAHELYLAHVGDSRAYWLTSSGCYLLTLDDNVAGREVRMGRSTYQQALTRTDAGILIQALGTRTADLLYPTVQRLLIEEDGILMLCSDGLSDNSWVEQSWKDLTHAVLHGSLPLDEAAQAWVTLADEKNGHDNTSVVLMHCQISLDEVNLFDPSLPLPPSSAVEPLDAELSQASKALLYDEDVDTTANPTGSFTPTRPKFALPWMTILSLLAVLLALGAIGFQLWRQTNIPNLQRPPQESSQPLP